MTVAVSRRLGPYEILAPLGAGGMGEVWRARDTRLHREIAIKVLPADLASDSRRLHRFEKESRAASALNHPNIVTIYEIGSSDATAWIAMECVDGKTLRDVLFSGALSMKRLLVLGAQIADGLAAAHEAGIVHRDLKPENVMVTPSGLVKILDFGLAKRTSQGSGSDETSHLPTETGTSPGMIVGTVGYMSPEQAAGQPVDFRSDQFSFGSILYELATGKRAFQKKTGVETLSAILREEPEPVGAVNPQAPAPLRWIVERCLVKDPEGRYASTKDLARELATLRDHLSETADPGASAAGLPGTSRARGAGAVLAILAAIALGAFAGRPLWKARFSSHPFLRQVTFRRAAVNDARFAPDGQTIVYGVQTTKEPGELFSARAGTPESRSLGLPPANIVSISSTGELAILVGGGARHGTLATVSLSGGAPRELLEDAWSADWAPDGKGLAIVHDVQNMRRLEFPLGKVLFETEGLIGPPRFSPKGDRLAFSRSVSWLPGAVGEGSVEVIDLTGKKIDSYRHRGEFVWSPSGDELWFSEVEEGTTRIRAVSSSGARRLVETFAGDFALHDVAREGRLLLERITTENEMVGHFSGETTDRTLSWLDGSRPADISADGTTVLFTEFAQGGGPMKAVYKRKMDGSPAVRLGEGTALALSPDGAWALSAPTAGAAQLVLLPMGPGQPRFLALPGIRLIGSGACFFPDGEEILLRARDSRGVIRLYVYEILSGKARPISPGGIQPQRPFSLAPDGKTAFAFSNAAGTSLYDVEDGKARSVPGLPRDLVAMKWGDDSRSLFVQAVEGNPLKVYRFDLSSQRLDLWKQIQVSDLSGVPEILPTSDGKSYVYWYDRTFSDLFVAEGLK